MQFVLGEMDGIGAQDLFIELPKCVPPNQKLFWRDFYVFLDHTRYAFLKVLNG